MKMTGRIPSGEELLKKLIELLADQEGIEIVYEIETLEKNESRYKEMKREFLTDEQVEAEISRLSKSDDVKLAKKENKIKNRRRQYMYQLRVMEKRGKELAELGITSENMEQMLFGGEDDAEE